MEREVAELVARLASYWNASDIEGVADLWDSDDPHPIYQPEEEEGLVASWPQLRAYLRRRRAGADAVAVRFSDIGVKLFAGRHALAHWRIHWDLHAPGAARPIAGECRAFALARLTPMGWRFHAYIEGPLAAIPYLRALAEARVTPGFT